MQSSYYREVYPKFLFRVTENSHFTTFLQNLFPNFVIEIVITICSPCFWSSWNYLLLCLFYVCSSRQINFYLCIFFEIVLILSSFCKTSFLLWYIFRCLNLSWFIISYKICLPNEILCFSNRSCTKQNK